MMSTPSDALSRFVTQLDPSSEVFAQVELRAPWGISETHLNSAYFSYVQEGICIVEIDGQPPVTVSSGQVVILPYGHAHQIKSEQSVHCMPADQIFSGKSVHEIESMVIGGDGEQCLMLCGTFNFAPIQYWGEDSLIGSLPSLFVVDAPKNSRLAHLLLWLYQENNQRIAGQTLALDHLMHLLLLEMLRNLQQFNHNPSWMIALGNERLAPVILAIQEQYSKDWTVAELADIAAMSRSVFSERFKVLTGTTPLLFLRQWRCFIAAQFLANGNASIKRIAERVGFQSADVFIRNFKQFHRCTPKQYAQQYRLEIDEKS
ncbi:AraC family transcriptional regulator [Vibrio sp. 10N.261.55.A7]|uniref:AraC family transcriptional regulator n=1 Tax=Vibrio sp. 10N.261.55.A7 TaxID=1880851 RepID=UPI000C862C41|nr:AraC family transcriptional regulator [Vibrio sp. 10N.261.55.A7]PMJ91607.1 hypothetical protein BCU12_09440 [Vibrio sp. 10N.261.55.A7]